MDGVDKYLISKKVALAGAIVRVNPERIYISGTKEHADLLTDLLRSGWVGKESYQWF